MERTKRLDILFHAYQKDPNNDLTVLLWNDEALAIVEMLSEIYQILELVPLCFSPSKADVTTKNKEALGLSLCDV